MDEIKISIDEFRRLEIRVARIIEANDHPDADRLYVLKIDLGGATKQIVAGIKTSYTKEALVGKEIIVINNLQPAVVRGVESQGMLLAVQDEQGICIVRPERDVTLGSIVK